MTYNIRTITIVGSAALLIANQATSETIAPEVQIVGDWGTKGVAVNEHSWNLWAIGVSVAGRWGDRILISANTGGTGCPVNHYWLDLTALTPSLSEPFGGCYEALDIEVGEDGTLFATPAGIETPTTYVFRGGTAIETSQIYCVPRGPFRRKRGLELSVPRGLDLCRQ